MAECINSNPDIAGIGIRFNFYTTILIATLTREKEYTKELLSGIYKNSVINGLGILFTAVIQTLQGKLDLYHAIVVMYILFFFNIVFLFGMYLRPFKHHSQELTGKRVGERKFVWCSQIDFQMFIYLLMHTFGVIVFFIWFLYVAIDGTRFGSQPSCNHLVNFVVFFSDVRATVTWFRVIMILFFAGAIPLFLFFLSFLIFAPAEFMRRRTKALDGLFENHPRLEWVRYVIGIPLVVYIVANLELIMYRNRSNIQPGENVWGFGQIIAIVLTLGIFMDMVVAIREWYRLKHHSPSPRSSPPLKNSED